MWFQFFEINKKVAGGKMKKKLFCISLYFILAMILSAQTTGGGEFFSGAVTLFNKIYTGFIVWLPPTKRGNPPLRNKYSKNS